MENVFKLLADLQRKPQFISADVTKQQHLSPEEKNTLQRIGISMSQLRASMTLETQVNYDRARFYQEVTRAMENALVGASLELYGEYACLTGDTKIPLLDGRTLTIKDMLEEYNQGKELWIYSCTNEGKPKAEKVLNVVKQSHTPKTFRIWLDNGKYVEASDNHRFVKRDGTLCRTDELKVNDSLMPFHRFVPKDGYERVWNIVKKNWDSTYKMVAESVNDINLEEYNKGRSLKDGVGTYLVVHHDDFIKENNDPNNLKIMTDAEHIYLHSKKLIERWQDSVWREMMIQKNIESHNTPEYLEWLIQRNIKDWAKNPERLKNWIKFVTGRIKSVNEIEKLRLAFTGKSHTEEHKQAIGLGVLKAVAEGRRSSTLGKDYVEKFEKVCLYCGKVFKVSKKYISRKFCCHECYLNTTRVKSEQRFCLYCGKSFIWYDGYSKDQKYCSVSCANKYRSKELVPSYNHKVIKIECIGEQEVYDISVSGSELFGLDCGIYIHNTNYNHLHNASVWVTSESSTYQKQLTDLLDRIGIEEKIFDWAWSTGGFGDLFVKINGAPGLGIVSIEDDDHPLNMSRIDHEGILIGFYNTPQGQSVEEQIKPPWSHVHFRLLGAKRKRPLFSDPLYAEFRTIHLMTGTDTKSVTSKYGTSLLVNALPIWKRLRMAEDSLLLARLTRGIIRYIWKMKVNGGNAESVAALMDEFSTLLKRARAVDNRSSSPYYDDKEQPMSSLEDIFIPVWGDSTNDLTYDKIGGEADIRWIVDITDLRDQLAKALRTPLVLLGGGSGDMGGLGDHSQAIEKLDIRFARSARRLQRALKEGVKRMCQIHLAWQNMDPDPNLFDVNMSETSTAEEDELATSLDKNVDVCMKMLDMLKAVDPEADQRKALDYLNMKILKLEDFKSDEFLSQMNTNTVNKEKIMDAIKRDRRKPMYNMDVMGALPFNRTALNSSVKRQKILEQSCENWETNFGNVKVREDKGIQQINESKQMNFKF